GPIDLSVEGKVGVLIPEAGSGESGVADVHAISPDLILCFPGQFLKSEAPVGRNPANVVGRAVARIRLRPSHVFRAIEGCVQINMVIPHGKAAEAGNILGETAIDEGMSRGSRCKIALNPGVTPCRRTVPQVFDGWVVVEVQSVNQ